MCIADGTYLYDNVSEFQNVVILLDCSGAHKMLHACQVPPFSLGTHGFISDPKISRFVMRFSGQIHNQKDKTILSQSPVFDK